MRDAILKRGQVWLPPPIPLERIDLAENPTGPGSVDSRSAVTARTFDDAVIERPIRGRRIELRRDRGWRWDELGAIDPRVGGAARTVSARLSAALTILVRRTQRCNWGVGVDAPRVDAWFHVAMRAPNRGGPPQFRNRLAETSAAWSGRRGKWPRR